MKKILSFIVILSLIMTFCNVVSFSENTAQLETATGDATVRVSEDPEENLYETIVPSDITINDLSNLLSGYLLKENKFSLKPEEHPEDEELTVFGSMVKESGMGFNVNISREISGIADSDNYVCSFTYCFDSFPGDSYFESATVQKMEYGYIDWMNTSPTYLDFIFDMLAFGQVMAKIDGHPSENADKIWPYVQVLLDAREEPQTVGDWIYNVSSHSPDDNEQFEMWYIEIDAAYRPE